jgi:hypothetical protein
LPTRRPETLNELPMNGFHRILRGLPRTGTVIGLAASTPTPGPSPGGLLAPPRGDSGGFPRLRAFANRVARVALAQGGGRCPITEIDGTIVEDLKHFVDPVKMGDPIRPLMWVSPAR